MLKKNEKENFWELGSQTKSGLVQFTSFASSRVTFVYVML